MRDWEVIGWKDNTLKVPGVHPNEFARISCGISEEFEMPQDVRWEQKAFPALHIYSAGLKFDT